MMGIERTESFEDQIQWLTEKDTELFSEKIKSKLVCKNYGFNCDFVTKGE